MERKSNKTDCFFVRENLFPYQEKQLSAKESDDIEKHLKSCNECSGIYSDFRSLTSIIDKRKSEVPNPFAATRIVQRIEASMEKERENFNPVFLRIFPPLSVSLLMLIAIIIGFSVIMKKETKFFAAKDHQNDIKAMKSGLNLTDFIDEDKIFFNNH
jgi:predicted anti-sigma-YlaC factor YlaD